MSHFFFFAWTAETCSTIKLVFILYFVWDPELESESEPESDSIRIPESGVGVGTAPPRLRTPGSLDALKPQNKNEHIARYEIGRFVLGFTGFAQIS